MAVKKSELYSSLWASCDELRGSMDASQYKNYVLVLLFMKYVSDKARAGDSLIEMPEGASFYDMLDYRGKDNIGEAMNTIIAKFAAANGLTNIIDTPDNDFENDEKLGKGKERIDTLSKLLNIFNKPELNFSDNRADGDDLLGDAYEYLMRHFATESGKSKGQFYTPAEVSRIMAQVVGIDKSARQNETVYDMCCGSGSLLLKAADACPRGAAGITIYGQEADQSTHTLAKMNMWLHGAPDADLQLGNTLAAPAFADEATGQLKQFDYGVANPPFSFKKWMNGIIPDSDPYKRFEGYGAIPPRKNGDYAFLMHFIKSLKSTGKACIVLPLGVLFRGNAEATIRRALIRKGYIKGIIGLPPNLFYGTGIAACLLVIDKDKDRLYRDEIFMIDASRSFIKDGPKNRLRERDIHKIVDTFNGRITTDPKYARAVPLSEIEDARNDYNLNLPRYIDSSEPEDIQDIEAHLLGGIPRRDVELLEDYWKVCPALRDALFSLVDGREDFCAMRIQAADVKHTIYHHPQFTAFAGAMETVFRDWETKTTAYCKALDAGLHPKAQIKRIAESLLRAYAGKPLTDKYTAYQHIMDYWAEAMQDDFYELAADGWKAGNDVARLYKTEKKDGDEKKKEMKGIEGLQGRLIPPTLIIAQYFATEQAAIDILREEEAIAADKQKELLDEHGNEDGLLAEALEANAKGEVRITKASLKAARKTLGNRNNDENAEEYDMLEQYGWLMEEEADKKAAIKRALTALEAAVIAKYPTLSVEEIKDLVVSHKWMATLGARLHADMDSVSHRLASRIKTLAERYETPLPVMMDEVEALTETVNAHLTKMEYAW